MLRRTLLLVALTLAACGETVPSDGPPGAEGRPALERPGQPPPHGEHRPPPPGMAGGMQHGVPGGAAPSGGAMQDTSGFPDFHDRQAPPGPAIEAVGDWSQPVKLTEKPTGGYRPQLAVSPRTGEVHVVYYDRADAGDIIRHRRSTDGGRTWTDPVQLGHAKDRNWGPDLVARDDGSLVVVYDHTRSDFTGVGYLTIWDGSRWSEPVALTPDDGGEIGSGHVAHGAGDTLAYIYIGKQMGPAHRFQARSRWFTGGSWSDVIPLSDGREDAWHTNVERRPDGSVLAGFDIGTGGKETTLYVVDGRDGAWGQLEDLTADGRPGERPHFAFMPDGIDVVTWFHRVQGNPLHVYVRAGKPGSWGPVETPSDGYGGFHFDPDVAVNHRGELCLVWGWDAGTSAELVYSVNKGDGWTPPRKVAEIGWGKPGLASIDADAEGRFHVTWNQGVRGYNEVYTASLEVR